MAAENPLLRFEPGLIIWTWIVFLVLLVVLRRIAWKPLLAALETREKKIHDALEQAEHARHETERVVAENERRISEAIQRSEEIIQQARAEAEHSRQQTLETARTESRRIVEQGMRRLESEQRAAMQEIRGMAADLAIQAAARLVRSSLGEEQQREIVEQFLNELPENRVN
jgi:F-type H+-transporting ATPase subunit b